METLTISPELKIAYDSSRSMLSAKCLESVFRKCFTPSLDIWSDDMTNLFAVTHSNQWFSTSAQDPFNIMEDLLMLRLPFFLRPPSHNTWDQRAQKHVHTCVKFCKRLQTHSIILTQEALNPRALCALDPLTMPLRSNAHALYLWCARSSWSFTDQGG